MIGGKEEEGNTKGHNFLSSSQHAPNKFS